MRFRLLTPVTVTSPLHQTHTCTCSGQTSSCEYSHDAGGHAVPGGAAGLLLLQLRTVRSSVDGELAHLPGAGALPFGPVGVVALLGAGGPLGPLGHVAVFGHDAGLEGDRQRLLGAEAGGGTPRGR